jgi:hypothetical protein
MGTVGKTRVASVPIRSSHPRCAQLIFALPKRLRHVNQGTAHDKSIASGCTTIAAHVAGLG